MGLPIHFRAIEFLSVGLLIRHGSSWLWDGGSPGMGRVTHERKGSAKYLGVSTHRGSVDKESDLGMARVRCSTQSKFELGMPIHTPLWVAATRSVGILTYRVAEYGIE
jgi:hypothetical protein